MEDDLCVLTKKGYSFFGKNTCGTFKHKKKLSFLVFDPLLARVLPPSLLPYTCGDLAGSQGNRVDLCNEVTCLYKICYRSQ